MMSNRRSGTVSAVSVTDAGGGGKKSDTLSITIRDAAGAVVYSASGPIGGGNIKIH